MALDKAIAHGKEHRRPYYGSKAIDRTCRNHGGCPWCKENRKHKFRDKHPAEDDNLKHGEFKMKVKLRKHVTYVDTLTSPYYGETGTHKRENIHAHCGKCDADIEEAHFYHEWSYCPYCGEKLDWPEDELNKG